MATNDLRIQRVHWSLLCEWWCVPISADINEVLTKIMATTTAPSVSSELVRNRLYGGFKCNDHTDCRHVAFNTGQFTWLNPEDNTLLTAEERCEFWKEAIDASRESGQFIGGGLFCEDAPASTGDDVSDSLVTEEL